MMMLIIGCVIFFGVHSIQIVKPAARSRYVARWGEQNWKLIYSALAGVGLILIIVGYGAARPTAGLLYVPPGWGRSLTGILMLPVFPLLFATYLPGRIQRMIRHPMLSAIVLWAIAHLLSNGGKADVILFGAFLVWSVADLLSYLYRPVRDIPRLPASRWNDLISIVAGLAVYALFVVAAHRWVTGIALV